ncbi:glycosyltransferase involved in cell wall biosynthesis [Aneurinibacillus soli]|uniref:Putative glycosyltransferase EpsD n=1 Tax=Aneurinibacillus soli TaxID=1500254 RepID=A0A0U5B0I6_9BACL|nr:glycosyltransferase family 4 protein [Aneurinibacillus soli]PYE64149.1 glycosyltransferase involved in cell wall biosynthesis [Aneurinibacillus soli]BAU28098.1 putative glycosyltransferase EpsD [Aneurinibacillus soli]
MKKILQVCAIDLSIEALLKPLIQALTKEGYIVHSACTDTGKFEALRQQQLTVINIPIKRKISLWSNLQSVWNLYQLIKKEKYDIVHVHTPIAAILGRIAAKLAGTPHIIYTAHGFYFHEGMSKYQYRFFYFLEKYFARYATDWLLLQSREDYELCLAESFKDKDKIIHISNGIDIFHKFNPVLIENEVKKEIREELGIEEGSIVFSFIGRFVREKGIFELIEAFHRIKQEFPFARLLMIGDSLTSERDQESYQRLKEMLNDEAIITPGFRKDIPELLAISDVFVLPSYREGLPRSIIEAMAMEKPIIATNIRGCREEVFPEENGFLVEKADVEDLYKKMVLLCTDKEKREKFGRCSRKIVEESFNEEKVINKQLSLFRRLTGE